MVNVMVNENADPARVGSVPAAAGFPMCKATVEYQGEGYLAMLGWIQNVGQASPSDDDLRFELDPFVLFEGIPTPYAIYGARPELFDAPHRSDRSLSLNWLAHSFLCLAPSSPFAREVEAVMGFSWGFRMDDGDVELVEATPLSRDHWSTHIDLLSTSYPAWSFTAARELRLHRRARRSARVAADIALPLSREYHREICELTVGIDRPIGPLVREIREQAGLSQSELAALVGTTQSAISRWERGGDEPRLSTLANIARACGRTASIVICDDIDRAQIRAHLAMAPVDRLRAVANVSRLRAVARPAAST